jgi:hypothetical protein
MKPKTSSSRQNVPVAICGAVLSVASVGAAAYSIFVWMLPGVDVGFADHLLVLGGMIGAVVGIMMVAAGLQRKDA